jgi:hypothetical protein
MDPELAGRTVFIKKNVEWYEAFFQRKASEEDWSGMNLGGSHYGRGKWKQWGIFICYGIQWNNEKVERR